MPRHILPLFLGAALFAPSAFAQEPKAAPLKPAAEAVSDARGVQDAFIRVATHVKPSVVTIYCETATTPDPKNPYNLPLNRDEDGNIIPDDDPGAPRTSLGTGMVVRADGYVLTNYHVVRGADTIHVLFNSDTEDVDRPIAKVVSFDEESDLAILKIARQNLAPVEWADSDAVRIGQWALAIGAPFDQAQTLTAGIISARGRHINKQGASALQDFLQTDAAINPGNSGGPLIDLDGRVIGVNTAILSPSRFNVGIGFSVPSNTVKSLIARLIQGQSIKRGFLGVQYVRLDDAVAKEWGLEGGLQIGSIAQKDGKPIGPAQEAGLREDDIIVGINGETVTTTDRFRALVAGQAPGTEMKFSVARPLDNGVQRFDVTIKLGDRAVQYGAPVTPKIVDTARTPVLPALPNLGLEVENAEKVGMGDRMRFQLDGKESGAVVMKVVPGSPADDAGMMRGLRIVRVRIAGTWKTITNAADWRDIAKAAPPESRLLIQLRDGEEVSVYKLLVAPPAPEIPKIETAPPVA